MIYEDGNVVADFAKRTECNLEFIETARKNGDNVFEVTQLVNSLLGLLIFPQQKFMGAKSDISLEKLEENGWPHIAATSDSESFNSLEKLVRFLRNAIAHCNIEFLTDKTEKNISGIKVWNCQNGQRNREAEIPIEELRAFTRKFIELILDEVMIKQRSQL